MANTKLVDPIAQWHINREHDKIVQFIKDLAPHEQSDEALSLWARALLNLDCFEEAIEVLQRIKKENQDGYFCVRYALALYPLHREPEALEWFKRAKQKNIEDINELPGTFFPTSVSKWIERSEIWAPRRKEKIAFEEARRAQRNKKYREKETLDETVLRDLWDDSDYSKESYTGKQTSDKEITAVEAELGYRLPYAYKELIKQHNGGMLRKNCFANPMQNEWSSNVFFLDGLYGIDAEKSYSLCGANGSRFWIEEWGYPEIGIAICDTISGGHDMIFLDYRDCGSRGEPCVVEVDQEADYEITYLADNFKEFIEGLFEQEEDSE